MLVEGIPDINPIPPTSTYCMYYGYKVDCQISLKSGHRHVVADYNCHLIWYLTVCGNIKKNSPLLYCISIPIKDHPLAFNMSLHFNFHCRVAADACEQWLDTDLSLYCMHSRNAFSQGILKTHILQKAIYNHKVRLTIWTTKNWKNTISCIK